ncbi:MULTISPECIES: MFS transporter [Micrococcaceae]|uniref:MFS transporter n=1 Tax=unclassified Kocuria TaxID=2649579 RepID=UPI001011887B|nr:MULTISPECIES: MFS transporter [unclassified Kocuria]
MSSPSTATAPPPSQQSHAKTLLGTGIGNALEWFDWNIYASFAVYFSTQVFNDENPQSAFLETMAVFAVGFVARPFGGFLFGFLGDRWGRKRSLTLAVVSASVGSLIVAVCPTYDQVGWLASALLLIGRLIQGLSHGGELPAAQTYLSEHAPREKRGLFASSIYVTGTLGLICGLVLGLILQGLLTEDQMGSWGWRVPFLVGALLGVVAIWIRSSMEESELFTEHMEAVKQHEVKKENILIAVLKNWRTGLQVILMTGGLTIAYYVWSVSMASLATTTFNYDSKTAFTASLIGNVVFIIVLPIWGALSDRIGRKPCILIAMIGSMVLCIPMIALASGGEAWQLVLAISIQLILLAGFLSHAPATYAEMFSTDQRTAGFGVPYSIAIAVFGGTAGYVLTWLGDPYKFAIYSMIFLLISALTVLTLPETKGKDLR